MASSINDLSSTRSEEDSLDEEANKPKVPRKKRKASTRSASHVLLVGKSIDRIAGSQLPTCRQAIRYYLHRKSIALTQATLDELGYEVVHDYSNILEYGQNKNNHS